MVLGLKGLLYNNLVAEWIHFTVLGDNITLPTIKLKVYTFWDF